MRRVFLFQLFCLVSLCCGFAQDGMTVLFWNTENLFDTVDDPARNDEDFTPDGDYHWTFRRYLSKLDAVARVIVAADEYSAPALVGLCEVENDSVLRDLTERSPLRAVGYRYVMTDSPDSRGIDVALLYRRNCFRLLGHESLRVDLKPYGGGATRDILHVTGIIESLDTLDIYVCHWPSRRGGIKESEPLRHAAAVELRRSVDSVFKFRLNPYVIIMGDLNEGPDDSAVRDGLSAHRSSDARDLPDRVLVTLMDNKPGSYKNQGIWDCFDQFVVSASLIESRRRTGLAYAGVFNAEFLLVDDDAYGGLKPFRTYNGRRYQNGYSDHLPIVLRLTF